MFEILTSESLPLLNIGASFGIVSVRHRPWTFASQIGCVRICISLTSETPTADNGVVLMNLERETRDDEVKRRTRPVNYFLQVSLQLFSGMEMFWTQGWC